MSDDSAFAWGAPWEDETSWLAHPTLGIGHVERMYGGKLIVYVGRKRHEVIEADAGKDGYWAKAIRPDNWRELDVQEPDLPAARTPLEQAERTVKAKTEASKLGAWMKIALETMERSTDERCNLIAGTIRRDLGS